MVVHEHKMNSVKMYYDMCEKRNLDSKFIKFMINVKRYVVGIYINIEEILYILGIYLTFCSRLFEIVNIGNIFQQNMISLPMENSSCR